MMRKTSITLPEEYLILIHRLIDEKICENRSECIRLAIEKLYNEYMKTKQVEKITEDQEMVEEVVIIS